MIEIRNLCKTFVLNGRRKVVADNISAVFLLLVVQPVQRQVQPVRHVLHEAGLAAAGWALDQHRHDFLASGLCR